MTKREKIILSLTGLAALVGLGSLYLGGSGTPLLPVSRQEANGSAKAPVLLKTIQEASVDKTEGALVAAIGRKWNTAALYDKPLTGAAATAARLPRYTGYVELGSGRLAIVDGIEYQVGDNLEGGGYKVAAISPDQVVLEILANGNRVEVPYEGQDAATH